MMVFLGSDKDGLELKETIKTYLAEEMSEVEVTDTTPEGAVDFIESSLAVANGVRKNEGAVGILFDKTGAGSFMAVTKLKGIVAAEVSDEHSAKMTRDHNNSSIITLGSGIVGEQLAKNIVAVFLNSEYSGGRHQIRVDMLDAMC
ncbi:galactose-6-phosphate isomerase subunit LacA [Atopococcus tabaci]|uniref:galactose-6-phosphate isomerase subunit LacA n=1 Tax=Atopococcus tabaci TaxID=269774 RepID=UPI000420A157|nr:galactose-6-phosphate isomerase subunit LacA [Atopococcus tabaci]